jgi:hypothetical protein
VGGGVGGAFVQYKMEDISSFYFLLRIPYPEFYVRKNEKKRANTVLSFKVLGTLSFPSLRTTTILPVDSV